MATGRFKGVVFEIKADIDSAANSAEEAPQDSRKLSPGNVIENVSTNSDSKVKALVGVGVATIILMSGLISYWFGSRRSGSASASK